MDRKFVCTLVALVGYEVRLRCEDPDKPGDAVLITGRVSGVSPACKCVMLRDHDEPIAFDVIESVSVRNKAFYEARTAT